MEGSMTMAEYRAGVIAINGPPITDEQVDALMYALSPLDGTMTVDVNRLELLFSFDAEVPPGFAPGVVQAVPRAMSEARSVLASAGLDLIEVTGISVERILKA
jgi:hypothetical protein